MDNNTKDGLKAARQMMTSSWHDCEANASPEQIRRAISKLEEATSILRKLHVEKLEEKSKC